MTKEAYQRWATEAYVQGKRDLSIGKKNLSIGQKRPIRMTLYDKRGVSALTNLQGTYVQGKRDLCIGKKDPCIGQKRPMYRAKETYLQSKIDKFI